MIGGRDRKWRRECGYLDSAHDAAGRYDRRIAASAEAGGDAGGVSGFGEHGIDILDSDACAAAIRAPDYNCASGAAHHCPRRPHNNHAERSGIGHRPQTAPHEHGE